MESKEKVEWAIKLCEEGQRFCKENYYNHGQEYKDRYDAVQTLIDLAKKHPSGGLVPLEEVEKVIMLESNLDVEKINHLAKAICQRFAQREIKRIDIVGMVAEIVSETHKRKEGEDMSDLIDKYYKKLNPDTKGEQKSKNE